MLEQREHATAFNKAPLVRGLTAILMATFIFSALVRVTTRVLAIIQSITVIIEGAEWLGRNNGLNSHQFRSILKGQYTSNVLYTIVVFLAKLSATRTGLCMMPREHRRPIIVTDGVIGVWTFGSVVALLLHCSLPKPWDYLEGTCFNLTAYWITFDIFHILADLAITWILFDILRRIQIRAGIKAMVPGVFGCRIFSNNLIFEMWLPPAILQVFQCICIVTTCIPFLKPSMDSLDSRQRNAGVASQTTTSDKNSRDRSTQGG
ncbi:hypothetical protein LB504_010027 [Fusarium proliferatum]|nr:hypothetical protein LB504_010027 [Fusarium proliferatum]